MWFAATSCCTDLCDGWCLHETRTCVHRCKLLHLTVITICMPNFSSLSVGNLSGPVCKFKNQIKPIRGKKKHALIPNEHMQMVLSVSRSEVWTKRDIQLFDETGKIFRSSANHHNLKWYVILRGWQSHNRNILNGFPRTFFGAVQ